MNTYTCATCGESVPRHEATVRSVAFRQVAYCRSCYEEISSPVVPEPRVAVDDLIRPEAV
jgi:NAD-dependent SIR2 family protein deacetylase